MIEIDVRWIPYALLVIFALGYWVGRRHEAKCWRRRGDGYDEQYRGRRIESAGRIYRVFPEPHHTKPPGGSFSP